nr:putative capsid protein [Crucivirus sp.]
MSEKKGNKKSNPKSSNSAKKSKRPKKITAERSFMKTYVPKGSFESGGKMLGNFLGGPLGGTLGGKAGDLLSKIVGFGDYSLQGNSIMTGGLSPPEIVNSVNRGGIIVRHREYLQDVIGSTVPFQLTNFSINPGLQSSFPWLAQIAGAFEEYEFRGLIYEFKSLSSDSTPLTTTTALGYVAMATQYNAAAPDFANKKELENYEFANSAKPSCSFIHPIECKRSLNVDTHLYTRTGAVPLGQDQKTYDLGDFQIAVGGMPVNGGIIGELWCTYEIEFFHPKYVIANNVDSDHFFLSGAGIFTNGQPVSLGTTLTRSTGSNLGMSCANNNMTFRNDISGGTFLFVLKWSGTGAVAVAYPVITTSNCTLLQVMSGGSTTSTSAPPAGTSSTQCMLEFYVRVDAQNASVILNGAGTLPTGTQQIEYWIMESATITA